jgi:membrane protease YdiL (CAAX protease family)
MTIQPFSDPAGQPGAPFGPLVPPVEEPRSPWRALDLVVFALFFLGTLLIIPAGILRLMRMFNPQLQFTELTAVDQVLIQGLLNLALVGFIFFLVTVVHRQSFLQSIHWFRNETYNTGFLIGFGASLALSVLVVSSFFPPSEPPPIEKLLSSTKALWVFVLFGIGVAPLFEEIIFRGFLFKVLSGLGGLRAAVFGTAVLFALLHIPQLWGSWAGIALIFLVGYVFSLVRERSNSLIPSFIMHTAYNTTLFTLFVISSAVQKNPG